MWKPPSITNCLVIKLGESETVTLQEAKQRFACFGAIADIKWVNFAQNTVQVTFFDVRAAAVLSMKLGPVRCSHAPQQGKRTVVVSTFAELQKSDFAAISRIMSVPDSKDSLHLVEFFDIRVAKRYAHKDLLSGVAAAGAQPPKTPPGLGFPAAKAQPRKVSLVPQCKRNSVGMEAAALNQPTVVVRGLPAGILNEDMMEAVLEQADLESGLVTYSMTPGTTVGEAQFVFSSMDVARKCMQHFDGCRWDPTGTVTKCNLLAPKIERPVVRAAAPLFIPTKVDHLREPMKVLNLEIDSDVSTASDVESACLVEG
mmetsp:Transcript_63835/g.152248  ORF Transcript_63835/g.152248 Transcript_63835/m.152248 type:complete len:313 (+) Transcript_63835:119-1057(+)